MKLALNQGLSGAASLSGDIERVLEAERLGYDSVWTSESYGSDAVTSATWIAARTQRIHVGTAIMQIAGRTPAATAMTAMTLDSLSGGRFRLGLGVSGPQVVEGWHGQPFGKPLRKTREYVAVVRAILRREKPLEFRGEYYQIPYAGADATGLGKPLRSILHGRADLPIYLAAIGPKNVALAAELADGWIPTIFSPRRMSLMPSCPVIVGDDVNACRATHKPAIALYVGGMGARSRNFYNEVVRRYGYDEAVTKIQDLYLAGRKAEAEAAVPDALVDEVALCGPRERIRERLAEWKAAGVTTLGVRGKIEAIRLLAALAL